MSTTAARPLIALSLMLGAAGIPGCASAPEPTERLATAKAGVRSAEELGAREVPAAALHVKLAQEQIARADELVEEGENERADALLRRATADANLAVALTREARVQNDAQAPEIPLDEQAE